MSELVISIGTDGTTQAMHVDNFDLGFLGAKSIRRQTEIVFDAESQSWDIVYIDDKGTHHPHEALTRFAGYEEARKFEVSWINDCRLHSLTPHSTIGFSYAEWMRVGDPHDCFTIATGECISAKCLRCLASS